MHKYNHARTQRKMENIFGEDGRPVKCSQDLVKNGHVIRDVSLSLLANGRLQMIHKCELCEKICVKVRRRCLEYSKNTESMFMEYFYIEHLAVEKKAYAMVYTKQGPVAVKPCV